MTILALSIVIIFNIIFYLNLNYISKKIGIFDYPDNSRKIHGKVIPPIGGVSIFASLILFLIISIFIGNKYYFVDYHYVDDQLNYRSILAFYLCSFFLFIVGLFDDKNGLSATLRLLLFGFTFYFSCLLDDQLILESINFQTLNIDIELDRLKIFFTIFCFLVLINSLNMFDGINIQSGLYLIILFSILAYKKIFIYVSLPIIISLIFFLYFNFKNKIFIGNHGIYFLSFILSFLIIKNYNTSNYILAEEVFLLLYLPILELLRLFILRVFRNKNPFKGDKNHIHHYIYKRTKKFNITAIYTNIISFLPFVIFLFYKSFYVLVFTIIFYFLFIVLIKKKN